MKDSQHKHFDLIVIGGGASGMMAAGTAAAHGKKVLILEKNNQLGKKLKITGGGRCNITNATFDERAFLNNFGEAEKFLYSPLSQFGVQDTFDFFTSRGLPLVIEANNRAFPHTHKAPDVYKVMEEYVTNENVTILTSNPVRRIHADQEGKKILSVETGSKTYVADNYVIATGGASHSETGSTGDGFKWLRDIGHTAYSPTPNIVPLKVPEKWVHSLSGKSIDHMKISLYVDGKKKLSKTGRILFTHFGVSGPLILNMAHKVSDLLHEGTVTANINMYPDLETGELEEKVLGIFSENKNKSFKNIVKDLMPAGFGSALLSFRIVPDDTAKVHSISRAERKSIVQLLQAFPMTITGLMGLDRAVISDGGVPLTEVDTKTMGSKLFDNLYLTGDILHINRPTGGYSLQLCWTTGYVAGLLG